MGPLCPAAVLFMTPSTIPLLQFCAFCVDAQKAAFGNRDVSGVGNEPVADAARLPRV
jgi:hypothetical protein